MFNKDRQTFSIRKLKNSLTASVKIGALVFGSVLSISLSTGVTFVNAEDSVSEQTVTTVDESELSGTNNDSTEAPVVAEPVIAESIEDPAKPVDSANVSQVDPSVPVEVVTLKKDVSSEVVDKVTASQLLGGTTVNHYSLFYNEYTGTINNADRHLQAGDYFKIKLDSRVGLDGVTVYNGGYSARPSESFDDLNTQKTVLNSYYNKDDHSMYYVFTPEAANADIIKWTVYTTDSIDWRKHTSNGETTFVNDYAGTPFSYTGNVDFAANKKHHPKDDGVNVEFVIAESDIVKLRYTQMFAISPQEGYEKSESPITYRYETLGNKTPASNLSLRVYAVPQDTPFLDSFHVDSSYREITEEVVKGDTITFSKGFSTGEKYLVQLENDFIPQNGISSSLKGGMQGKILRSLATTIQTLEPGGFAELILAIKSIPNEAPNAEKPVLDISVPNLPGELPPTVDEKPELPIGLVPNEAPKHEKPELPIGLVPNEAPKHEKPRLQIDLPESPVDEEPKNPGKSAPPTPTESVPNQDTSLTLLPKTGTDNNSVLPVVGLSMLALCYLYVNVTGKKNR